MPQARNWTETADMAIRTMRAEGRTWEAIGARLGLSRNTVIERGRRLCAQAPKRGTPADCEQVAAEDPNRAPLPAGHPATWHLLTAEEFPKFDDLNNDFRKPKMPSSASADRNKPIEANGDSCC